MSSVAPMTRTSASAISLTTRNPTEPAAAEADAGAVAALIERGGKIVAGGADGGNQAEENPGKNRDAQGEQQDVEIERDGRSVFADARKDVGADAEQHANSNESQDQAKHSAGERDGEAFREQLADDVPAACAECGTGGQFALSGGGAHQQKIGNVGTGDQQHQADGAEQDQERRARVADDRLLQRHHAEATLRAERSPP